MPQSLGDPEMPRCACGAAVSSSAQTVCSTCQNLAAIAAALEGNP